jgi:butyryl-CoA dehydrogenase
MNFKLSEEQRIFRETVRGFARREVAPLVEEAEGAETFPREVLRKAARLGLLAVGLPEESGGTGGDLMYMSLFVEELARECAGIALPLYACASMAWGLDQSGSEEQKQKYLKPLLNGEAIAGLAITEPDAGSDLAAIRTSAVRDGDDYVLNGRKVFITNGPIADFILVIANVDKDRHPRGIRNTKEASMAKLFATESCVKITGDAVQIHGGYGYSTEYPVERYFRDAKLMTIFEGTSEIQNVVIARELGL